MPLAKNRNSSRGRDFEKKVCQALQRLHGVGFGPQTIKIGSPPKAHRFDIVSEDANIVGECKSLSWTKNGNVPSGKIASINEAVLYLSYAPRNTKKVIVLRRDRHPSRKESLAEYYVRTYYHLLRNISVMELNIGSMRLKEISKTGSEKAGLRI